MPATHRTPSLTAKTRPSFGPVGAKELKLVDLFAGCGGITLGVAQAVQRAKLRLDIKLALDFEDVATKVYKANFPKANAVTGSVEDYFDGELGEAFTATELRHREAIGTPHLLVGGPPCQGHSDLNNHTRREDPKNKLYAKMARAAAVLKPTFVLIENVPSVRFDTANIVQTTVKHLEDLGYVVGAETIGLHALGVAQRRRRHVLLASLDKTFDPQALLDSLAAREEDPSFNLARAIKDLSEMENRAGYDVLPKASAENQRRMEYMIKNKVYDLPNPERPACHRDNAHSYKSMYGRLSWDAPAQTITSGFGSIGQGRYMHPDQPRALTGHEAARIQGFPDYFDFSSVQKRADLATMIGNAVPPALGREIATVLLDHLFPNIEQTETTSVEELQPEVVPELVLA